MADIHLYVKAAPAKASELQAAVSGNASLPDEVYQSCAVGTDIIAEALYDQAALDAISGIDKLGEWYAVSAEMARHYRQGTVITVTNTNDSGAGSLREALGTSGNRVIVFTTSGTIQLLSPITVTYGNVLVRGETAPNGGICVRDWRVAVEASNVLFRHMRFRLGDAHEDDAAQNNYGTNIWYDHCSFSWGVDETVDIWELGGILQDVFLSWCIVSESLYDSVHAQGPHSMGLLIGGGTDRVTLYACLLAYNDQRNPMISSGRLDMVNCLIAGWKSHGMYITNAQEASYVNVLYNYFEASAQSLTYNQIHLQDYDTSKPCLLYQEGNRHCVTAQDWAGTVESINGASITQQLAWFRQNTRFPVLRTDYEIMSAADAYTAVLAGAGATKPKRDAVDARIVQLNGAIIDSQADVGGWPDLTV